MNDLFAGVRAEMNAQIEGGLRPTLQIAIDWGGRRVDLVAGEGASAESSYLLWSSTKPFVALAALSLVESGVLDLEERVRAYLPEFGRAGKESATLAHVLTHRGGFPDAAGTERRALARLAREPDAALAYVCEMPALWEPGTDRGYHPSSGWYVLGAIIERVERAPLAAVVRERVLDPAGIAPDGFSLGEPERLSQPPVRVVTNGARGAPAQSEADYWSDPTIQASVIPGGGGISRASEVVKLYRALLDGGIGPGGRLLSPQMLRRATFPHAVGVRDRTFLLDIPWGLGFHLKHAIPSLDDCGKLAAPGSFGHAGHFLVNTSFADPSRDLAVCILSNGLAPSREGMAAVSRLSDKIHEAIDSATEDPVRAAWPRDSAGR